MTDVDALKKRISESGLSVSYISRKTGILRETMYNRFKTGNFKLSEICALVSVLNLSEKERNDIFFADDSE